MSFWKSLFGNRDTATEVEDWTPEAPYCVPPDTIIYAIGDIHGRLDLLAQLMDKIRDHRAAFYSLKQAYVVFLGDYVDRGFQSRQVLDYLQALRPEPGLDFIFLAGNHEDLMLGFMEDPFENLLWLKVGGLQTLMSYGINVPHEGEQQNFLNISNDLSNALPAAHKDFLCNLKTWWRAADYLFVHAGIRPGLPLDQQRRRDLLGIRQEFTQCQADFGFRVVHGHTGVAEVSYYPNRVAVDTGAFATGRLSAAIFWEDQHATLMTGK